MRPITDAEVAALPLDGGRAHLMEAIMSTDLAETAATPRAASRPRTSTTRRRTAGVLAVAAASVAVIAAAPLWLGAGNETAPPGREQESAPVASEGPASAPSAATSPGLFPVVDDVPEGWELGGVSAEPVRSVSFERRVELAGEPGALTFTVEVRDADDPSQTYRQQRDGQVTQGGRPAGTIDVDGRTADVWVLEEKPGSGTGACSADCVQHWSAITPVEGGQYALVIASGLTAETLAESEWRALVAGVRLTDHAGFDAWVPSSVVLPAEERQAIADALTGVEVPDGFDPANVRLYPYSNGGAVDAQVATAAACAWVEQHRTGGAAARSEAADALRVVETWPLYADLESYEQDLLSRMVGEVVDPGATGTNVLSVCD